MNRLRRLVPVVAAVAVVVAAAVVVAGTLRTSSARVAAQTSGTSFISAGSVVLDRIDTRVDLIFDANGIYPGLDIEGCVDVVYAGSIDADLRLHSARVDGNGLEQFIDFVVEVIPGGCATATAPERVYADTLDTLLERHTSYGRGVPMWEGMKLEDLVGVRAIASVQNDDDAQGLTVDFLLTLEARP